MSLFSIRPAIQSAAYSSKGTGVSQVGHAPGHSGSFLRFGQRIGGNPSNFPSPVVPVEGFGRLSSEILEKLTRLEEAPALNRGFYGEVYRIETSQGPLIVKQQLPGTKAGVNPKQWLTLALSREKRLVNQIAGRGLLAEAKIIQQLPASSALQLIGVAQNHKGPLVVLTSVPGQSIDVEKNPLTLPQLQSLLTELSALDQQGIFHGDLNSNNMLTEAGKTHVLDYGKAFEFKPYYDDSHVAPSHPRFQPEFNIFVPPFGLVTNADSFASDGLQMYFDQLRGAESVSSQGVEQIDPLFTGFLKAQGLELANALKSFCPTTFQEQRVKEYESLRAKYYGKVDEAPYGAVKEMEAWKNQSKFYFLCSWRVLARFPFQGQKKALLFQTLGVRCAEQLKALATSSKTAIPQDPDYQKFLGYQSQYADFLIHGAKHHYPFLRLAPTSTFSQFPVTNFLNPSHSPIHYKDTSI